MLPIRLYELSAADSSTRPNVSHRRRQPGNQHQHHHCLSVQEQAMSARHRDGKFARVSEFIAMAQPKDLPQSFYKQANLAHLEPGCIIYVKDVAVPCGARPESRINNRVVVILRASSANLQCLTFCNHWPKPADPKTHWRVCAKDGTQSAGYNENMAPLEIVLQPFGPAERVSPANNITINTFEFWNVETEVTVAVLGFVEPEPLRKLVERVQVAFCQSLDEAVPPVQTPKGPDVNETDKSVTQRHGAWARRKSGNSR